MGRAARLSYFGQARSLAHGFWGPLMKIHEYQAKELLAAAGAAIPRGIVVTTAAAAVKAFDDMGGKPVVLKAQVHAGGRRRGSRPSGPRG